MTANSDRGVWPAEECRELAPCPFCGDAPSVVATYVDTGSGDGAYSYRILCERHYPLLTVRAAALGQHGYVRDDDPPSEAAARASVREAWNQRRF